MVVPEVVVGILAIAAAVAAAAAAAAAAAPPVAAAAAAIGFRSTVIVSTVSASIAIALL